MRSPGYSEVRMRFTRPRGIPPAASYASRAAGWRTTRKGRHTAPARSAAAPGRWQRLRRVLARSRRAPLTAGRNQAGWYRLRGQSPRDAPAPDRQGGTWRERRRNCSAPLMREFDAWNIKRDRALVPSHGQYIGRWYVQDLSLLVDKPSNQPRASDTINFGAFTGPPFHRQTPSGRGSVANASGAL